MLPLDWNCVEFLNRWQRVCAGPSPGCALACVSDDTACVCISAIHCINPGGRRARWQRDRWAQFLFIYLFCVRLKVACSRPATKASDPDEVFQINGTWRVIGGKDVKGQQGSLIGLQSKTGNTQDVQSRNHFSTNMVLIVCPSSSSLLSPDIINCYRGRLSVI